MHGHIILTVKLIRSCTTTTTMTVVVAILVGIIERQVKNIGQHTYRNFVFDNPPIVHNVQSFHRPKIAASKEVLSKREPFFACRNLFALGPKCCNLSNNGTHVPMDVPK